MTDTKLPCPQGETFTRDDPNALRERRSQALGSTFDPNTREVQVVFATESAGVDRMDQRGAFTERLALDGFTVSDNAPFLDSHKRDSFDSILGNVVSTKVENGQAWATVRLSSSNAIAQRLASDLSSGAQYGVSVGYQVDEWEERQEAGKRVKVAKKWTIREISLVAVPADAGAGTRSQPDDPTQPVSNRAETNAAIRSIAQNAGLGQTWIDQQIDGGATFDQARAAASRALITRGQAGTVPNQRVQIGMDYTDPEVRARTMGEALFARVNPRHNLSDPARLYAAYSIMDMARDCLRQSGVPMQGMSNSAIVSRALHSTSDFAAILGDATGRTMMDAYRVAETSLKRTGRQVNAVDFRTRHRLRLSEGPELEQLNESGEIKAGSLAEAEETYKIGTYAKRVGISRQIIINDDLGAFSDIARRMGQGAAVTEAKFLANMIAGNPKMADGKGVFHTDHGNVAATGSALSVDALASARTAMRRQTTLQGNPMTVRPTYLVVPPELETGAEKILSDIAAATVDDANPFSSSLQLIVEPYLSDQGAWYVAAAPGEADGFEWSYLQGEEGPQTETREGWEIEGAEIKVRLDFGGGFVDHRGWYRNAGG